MASVVKRHSKDCTTRGSRCKCSWSVRWRDSQGQHEKSYPHDKKTIANDLARKVEGDKIAGIRTITSTVKFGAYAEKIIRQRTTVGSTKRRYLSCLHNHLGELADKKLSIIATDRAGIKTFLLETLPARGLGQVQVEIAKIIICSVVAEAVRDKEIPSHDLASIRLPARDETADDDLIAMCTNGKVQELADAMPPELAIAVWLARGCGLRVAEVLAIKASDFTGDMTVLTVSRQVESGIKVKPLKSRKPGETRSLPVPLYVAERVSKHVADHGDGYLFTGSRTPFVSLTGFNIEWRKARDTAGMRGFRFHDLRHTYASHLLANGIDLPSVSKWLGHKSVDITARIYSHSLPKTFEAARAFLDSEWK